MFAFFVIFLFRKRCLAWPAGVIWKRRCAVNGCVHLAYGISTTNIKHLWRWHLMQDCGMWPRWYRKSHRRIWQASYGTATGKHSWYIYHLSRPYALCVLAEAAATWMANAVHAVSEAMEIIVLVWSKKSWLPERRVSGSHWAWVFVFAALLP